MKNIRVKAKELTINTLQDESFGFITIARNIIVVACKPANKDSLNDVVYYKLSLDRSIITTIFHIGFRDCVRTIVTTLVFSVLYTINSCKFD